MTVQILSSLKETKLLNTLKTEVKEVFKCISVTKSTLLYNTRHITGYILFDTHVDKK